uniref:Ovule protein n=1 Tax=Haemonchus placei TaxID=6290 RepID=A0A0N4WUG0_HAEPC
LVISKTCRSIGTHWFCPRDIRATHSATFGPTPAKPSRNSRISSIFRFCTSSRHVLGMVLSFLTVSLILLARYPKSPSRSTSSNTPCTSLNCDKVGKA